MRQGHCNTITCLAVSVDRTIIITADAGYESLMVLWNARTGEPVRSMSQPHKHGVVALDVSLDGQWLASVGAPHPETKEQEVRGCGGMSRGEVCSACKSKIM